MGLVCEQAFFWGLVHERRSRESEGRSRERADERDCAIVPGSLSSALSLSSPLVREAPRDSPLTGYVESNLESGALFPGGSLRNDGKKYFSFPLRAFPRLSLGKRNLQKKKKRLISEKKDSKRKKKRQISEEKDSKRKKKRLIAGYVES